MVSSDAVELVRLGLKATTAYHRDDLSERLRVSLARVSDPRVRVLVAGEFKQGKSHLVNALVNAPVCPVDDDVATAVPTVIQHGEHERVRLVWPDEPGSGDSAVSEPTEITPAELVEFVSEAGNPKNRRQLTYAEVSLPRRLLAKGLVLVDTPGMGGLSSAHGAATVVALPRVDAVLLVSDAAQEYTAPEMDFLQTARRLCPNIACVVTKTDLYPRWRRIVELDQTHLSDAGLRVRLFPVSSTLREHALHTQDEALQDALMDESGYVELIHYLQRDVIGQVDDLERRCAGHDVLAVAGQLATSMRAELTIQEDPHQAADLVAELTEARERVDELAKGSAQWHQTLKDGMQDLTSDIEYDLRDRLRAVSREAEHAIEHSDPKDIWDQLVIWVEQQVSHAASQTSVWAIQRAQWLAGQVAEHFGSGTDLTPQLDYPSELDTSSLKPLEKPEMESDSLGDKLFTSVRGGYSGMMITGMAMSLAAGIARLNPFSAVGGLLFGGKTLHDQLKHNRQRREAEATSAVRQYIGEVTFQLGRETRDLLRQTERTLRDHFITLAEQMRTSRSAALESAQRALNTEESERDKRIRDLRAELDRIDHLSQQAALLADPAGEFGLARVGEHVPG